MYLIEQLLGKVNLLWSVFWWNRSVKLLFPFPWNPCLKTDGTSMLLLLLDKNFKEKEINFLKEWFLLKKHQTDNNKWAYDFLNPLRLHIFFKTFYFCLHNYWSNYKCKSWKIVECQNNKRKSALLEIAKTRENSRKVHGENGFWKMCFKVQNK